MDEDAVQPTDRRIGNVNTLPPGPPGVELDTLELDNKKSKVPEKEGGINSSKTSRRRSPSGSPPRSKRKSLSRNRRSPTPAESGSGRRRRRSPSPPPRRNRFRNFSPDRRRFDSGRNMRRSPDRRRGRFRFRGRSDSRSRSRSISPRRGGGIGGSGMNRWSPKKKPSSPLSSNGPPPPPPQTQPPAQYNVLPPQLYAGDTYAPTAYNQYSVPPPQTAPFPTGNDGYGLQGPAPPAFNAAYPPPPAWGVNDGYQQQTWITAAVPPDPNQIQQLTQQPPPTVAPPPVVPIQPPPQPQIMQQNLNRLPDAAPGTVEPNPAHDAVAQEAENQRDELKRQRASYLKKTNLLKKELKMLKEQRKDLNSGGMPPSPTTKGFIDENEKLQSQIQKKVSTIENVIDMLTGIIGDENLEKEDTGAVIDMEASREDLKMLSGSNIERTKKKRKNSSSSAGSTTGSSSSSSSSTSSSSSENEEDDDDSSPERLKTKAIESMRAKTREGAKKDIIAMKAKEEKLIDENRFNYVFYDPEMHWCQTCDIFPKTAKDYLNHLHTKEHMDRESIETPWHLDMVTDQYPTYENAPTKRTPIRGLTFFVPATAWFCKLCSVWMGDLHCASTHLKSQLHSNKYNAFLEKNPHFEVNWLSDRQRLLNEKTSLPLPPQITSVSTTGADDGKKSKRDDDKISKKRKKKGSDKKDKKKKRKRSKKRKKNNTSSSTSNDSSSSSSSESEQSNVKKLPSPIVIQSLNNPNPAASIRVAMRKQELKGEDDVPPPAPRMRTEPAIPAVSAVNSGRIGKWIDASKESISKPLAAGPIINLDEESKQDDVIIQQWNTVQPVISESEKKLLEQLKGKLKNKPRDESARSSGSTLHTDTIESKEHRERPRGVSPRRRDDENDRDRNRDRSDRGERRRRSRSPAYGGRGGGSGGRRMRRTRSRSRSRSRGRNSPIGRRRRSRSRSLRRRSRSFDRRRRYSRSRTRSRTRSSSRNIIEKPIVRHSEFRPRVPEKDKEKEKKLSNDTKEKKDAQKKTKTPTTTAGPSGKKLPFIGKMPVFKKQTSGQVEGSNGSEKRNEEAASVYAGDNSQPAATGMAASAFAPHTILHRPPPPTAAQIQMAMMEDVFGNAPPFHPDAGMMVDYDDLMPDPVQFVNLMGQAPPPPPPANGSDQQTNEANATDADDADMLPPGIDENEGEDFVPKPISDAPMPQKGPLPKDLEEALNIIFPGEKKPGEANEEDEAANKSKNTGETQIIVEEPVMQVEDLVKEGIHLVTIEETSIAGMDEASQLSMNEPLIFNKPASAITNDVKTTELITEENSSSQNAVDVCLSLIDPPPVPPPDDSGPSEKTVSTAPSINNGNMDATVEQSTKAALIGVGNEVNIPTPDEIPMPASEPDATAIECDLDDIPQPPPSPTESEKNRRQEELDDLAMLGIDADDMAAQCI